jgi:hypothetical protein
MPRRLLPDLHSQGRLAGGHIVPAQLLATQAIALAPQPVLIAAQTAVDRCRGGGIRRFHGGESERPARGGIFGNAWIMRK